MASVRRISHVACFFLVLLRVSIGWQFLYEGLWKCDSLKTAQPWTAEGYLRNAQGPFRGFFRGMVDDPDSWDKLDEQKVSDAWDSWRAAFESYHPELTDEQKQSLTSLLNGPQEFVEKLAKLPASVDLTKFKTPKGTFLKFDPQGGRVVTNLHLLPSERDTLLSYAPLETEEGDDQPANAAEQDLARKYHTAILRLYDRTSKLSLRERLKVLLKEDPARVGSVNEEYAGSVDHSRPGDLQLYRHWLERFENEQPAAKVHFQQEHAGKLWQDAQEKRSALIGPVDALTAELKQAATKLLSLPELSRGLVPPEANKIQNINRNTIWALIILGALLMVGLFSRTAALGAAGLLLMFYLAIPPWPGVPQPPGPEHSLIVNKNLIECLACLALVFLPSGRWMGLDALVHRFVLRRKTD